MYLQGMYRQKEHTRLTDSRQMRRCATSSSRAGSNPICHETDYVVAWSAHQHHREGALLLAVSVPHSWHPRDSSSLTAVLCLRGPVRTQGGRQQRVHSEVAGGQQSA